MKNFATFENQTISFDDNFNGIVGETGSGKSLILDAFQLLLGSRADKKLVRKGAEFAIIEGTFAGEGNEHNTFFDSLGFPVEDEGEVVVKRILYSNGKSKCYLNHLSCSLGSIKSFARHYIDLVGQFENQKLSSPDYQLRLLDLAAKNEDLLDQYKELFSNYQDVKQKILDLSIKQEEKESREDYLKYQIEELSKVELSQEIEDELTKQKNKILSHEEALKTLQEIQYIASESDHNVISQLSTIRKIFLRHEDIMPDASLKLLESTIASFEDFSFSLTKAEDLSGEDESLEEIMNQLDFYQKLKRKYHCSLNELNELLSGFTSELSQLNEIDKSLVKLEKEREDLENKLEKLADKLHQKRAQCSESLESKITKGLNELNMKGSTFKIALEKSQTFQATGRTSIQFKAETNKGEGYYKIGEIASGGELSRILLTLRNIVTSSDSISIFFFDEIDTGIGGETAKLIAKKLKELSESSQILAITHLPQIAKVTDKLIYVDKKSFEQDSSYRTVSFVSDLSKKERKKVVEQLAGL